MTEFKQLQQAANMTNIEVAEYFDVTLRTVFRWRSGESKPSALVMWLMGNLATIQYHKEVTEGEYE